MTSISQCAPDGALLALKWLIDDALTALVEK